MKTLGAALIAMAILYVVDSQYNGGRYAEVIGQAITSIAFRWWN
jgi:hypothetical protein